MVVTLFLLLCGIAGADNSTVDNATPIDMVNTTIDNATQVSITPTPLPNDTGILPATGPGSSVTTVIPTITGILTTAIPTSPPSFSTSSVEPVVIDPVLQQQFLDHGVMPMHNITTAQRLQAARDAAAKGLTIGAPPGGGYSIQAITPFPGGTPDYFGNYPNYANSQLPIPLDGLGNATPGTGIRKFVDSLPGLGPSGINNLGQYIPVAQKDTVIYPGSDYYEIAVVQYVEKMHSDLNETTLRGYVQIENGTAYGNHIPLFYPNGQPIRNATGGQVYAYDRPHYLGPIIVATKDVPVRVKFQNYLPNGTDGNLFIPVDTTLMGAGVGPDGSNNYKENRVTIHLHGGNTPWISDGTPHQWVTPGNEDTPYPKGVSVKNVPDMDGGVEPNGTMTFYYTNNQSARLMFYHDHALGITRLNVYAGVAAGYLLGDTEESAMVASGAIPADQIPLIIQDKTFVPNRTQLEAQDPTWNWGNTSRGFPFTGDLWFPHVYMPLQNPADFNNVNAMGRWDYGPWAWPPYMAFLNEPSANPYVSNGPWENPTIPPMTGPSTVPESFMDTPVVNGVAYPFVQLGPHTYRFRILNACNDRTLNLGFYYAASNDPMWSDINLLNGSSGEVRMVPAVPGTGLPDTWPQDSRPEGVPDPAAAGPTWIQIGTEGGFMPEPAYIPPTPLGYDYRLRTSAVTNIGNHSLLLMPAQRADVIVNFSGIPDGTKLILYNDAPAPAPGGDSRYDYFTNDSDQTAIGGAPTTLAGYGPNTRTIMQVQISSAITPSGPTYVPGLINTSLPAAYAASQDKPIVPQDFYNAPFTGPYPANNYINLTNLSFTFTPADGGGPVTMGLQPKAIIGDFEMQYGRLTAVLGTEIRRTPTNIESRVPAAYLDPPTEILNNSVSATQIGSLSDGTQIWRITNADVDLHPVHWHMVNLQVINRVIWDGTVLPPEPNERGWRETINTPPLMDTIVALRPITPPLPWDLPNSIRLLDPTHNEGTTAQFGGTDPTGGQAPVSNHLVNFGEEFVWHCHILGHEENDFMHVMSIAVAPRTPPSGLTALWMGPNSSPTVNLSWVDNSVTETNWTIQRSPNIAGPWTDLARSESTTGPATGGTVHYYDQTVALNTTYYYQVRATNWVGDITAYSWTSGYPNMAVNSTPSNMATPSLSGISFTDFIGEPTSGTAPLSVQFTDISTGTSTAWNWTFGDGSYNETHNPEHIYLAPGTYTVTLRTNNLAGSNTTTKSNYIVVDPAPVIPPTAAFIGTPTSGVATLDVMFNDTSSDSPTVWRWDFGDGLTSMERNISHTYGAPGNYTVSLIASNAGGADREIKSNYIHVAPAAITPPTAAFTGTPTDGIATFAVMFNDTSSDSPTIWRWDFGDGLTSMEQNISHTYGAPGNYTASLIASNAGGADREIKSNYIHVAPAAVTPPTANFDASPREGVATLDVAFEDDSVGATLWQWDFGDHGATSMEPNPSHMYGAPGNYTVSLVASNAGGSDTETKTDFIHVSPAAIPPPVANFTGTPRDGTNSLTVTFTDSSTPSATLWQWTFGDGNISFEPSPVHEYVSPGNYTVSLTASNAGGSDTLTRIDYIHVSGSAVAAPIANFTGTPTSGAAPLTVVFTDSSTNTPNAWSWTFGDGNVTNATVQNPVHTYLTRGNYTVSLTASNAGGSDTITRVNYITVRNASLEKVGIFQNGSWYLDYNGNGVFDSGVDKAYGFGAPGVIPVVGDWNGDTTTKIGFYINGTWYLDYNGNGAYDPGVDKAYAFGAPGFIPVVGDWNGDGKTEIGFYINGTWYLDYNGNGVYDPGVDKVYGFGAPGFTPVVGDWNGDGKIEIGIYINGTWYLDYNGNGVYDPGVDKAYGFGAPGFTPVVGDWNGDGKTEIGFFVGGTWYLDYNGNGVYDPGVDKAYGFGAPGFIPVVGDWSGDGTAKIGFFVGGTWYLDYNGNGVYDPGVDKVYGFGAPGFKPIVGKW